MPTTIKILLHSPKEDYFFFRGGRTLNINSNNAMAKSLA
jgi:hypothetical protein